jgi:hypothetical protein
MELQTGVDWAKYTAETPETACQRFVLLFKKNITSKLAFTTHTRYNSKYNIVSCINPMNGIMPPLNNHQTFPRLSGSLSAFDRLDFLAISRADRYSLWKGEVIPDGMYTTKKTAFRRDS